MIETKTSAGRLVTLIAVTVFALTLGVLIGRNLDTQPTVSDQQLKIAQELVEARAANRIYLATIHHLEQDIDQINTDRQLLVQALIGMPTTGGAP